MKHTPLALPCLLAAVLLGAGQARAEPVWNFAWSTDTPVVFADGSTTSGLSLTPGSGQLSGSQNFAAAAIDWFSDADPGLPATFTDQPFHLTLTLEDDLTKESGLFAFDGVFFGTASTAGPDVQALLGESQTQVLGGNSYTVSLSSFFPPILGAPGSLFADVSVVPGPGSPPEEPPPPPPEEPPPPPPPPQTTETPEPATLLLAGLGLSLAGVRSLARRRKAGT
jgi:hypothetical protein